MKKFLFLLSTVVTLNASATDKTIIKSLSTAREEGYRSGIEDAARVAYEEDHHTPITNMIRHLSTNRDNAKVGK